MSGLLGPRRADQIRPICALPGSLGNEPLRRGPADADSCPAVALAGSLDAVAVGGLPNRFVGLKAGAQSARDCGERACHPCQGRVVADVGLVTSASPRTPASITSAAAAIVSANRRYKKAAPSSSVIVVAALKGTVC